MTKPSTPPTTKATPLASPSQRAKFTFTIPMKNKGLNTDQSKPKSEAGKLGEKEVSSPSTENAHSDPKSPIASSVKKAETVAKSETTEKEAKPDGSEKEKLKEPLVESFPLKKEEKERSGSPSKKPRPPPLFIPRPVAQGKGTPVSATRATTPWKVTPKTTSEPQFGPMSPPPPGALPPQQSPSSAMSDTSSTSSMMGKTGEWSVTDKTILTPGPRLPERQHAGWQVSRKTDIDKEEVSAQKGEEDRRVNDEESDRKRKKKKHKKEKKKKKEKSKKNYQRLDESEGDDDEKNKKRKKKKDKHGKKQQRNSDDEKNISEEKSKSKKLKRKYKACNEDEDETTASKRPCLVSYDDSSSSSSSEQISSSRDTRKSEGKSASQESSSESRVPIIYDDDDDGQKKKHAARRATWDGSRDSSTVAQLLSDGKGLHGYGSSVTSWEGGESIVDSSVGEPNRKRQQRDSWDDEYDRGKEKKIQKSKDTRERHWNGNPFQREHEKRNMKQGFKDRFSRQLSKNQHSHHSHFKSHSSRKYRRFSN